MTRMIRPSSLTDYADCSRRWAARHMADDVTAAGYDLRQTGPTHIGAAVGSGVHAGVAYTMATKAATGNLGNGTEAEDRAEAEFTTRSEYGVRWDDTTPRLDTAKKQLVRMTRSYRRNLAPEVQPLLVEQRLECDAGDGWGLSGQADTLAGDPDNVLRDLKTGVRHRAHGVQYATYALIFRAHGYAVRSLVEDFLPRVKIDREQPAPVSFQIDLKSNLEDAWGLVEDIKRTAGEFDRRVADPTGASPIAAFRANPQSQLCGDRWCPAWGTRACSAHKH